MFGQLRRVGLIGIALFVAVQVTATQIVGPTDSGGSDGGSGAGGPGGSGSGTRPPGAPTPGDSGTGTAPATCEEGPGASTIPGSFIYDGGGAKDINNDVTCFTAGDGDWETVTTS